MTGKSVFSTPHLDNLKKYQDYLKNTKKVFGDNKKKASLRKTNPVNIT